MTKPGGLDPDPASPADDENADESTERAAPPLTPDDIKFMTALDGEVLAVKLGGARVGRQHVAAQLVGGFIEHLGGLVDNLASRFQPTSRADLATPELVLAGVEWGQSVVLHFSGASGEALQLSTEGYLSAVEEAVKEAVELVENAASEEHVIEIARRIGDRASNEFLDLLDVLLAEDVDSTWQLRDREPVRLSPSTGARAKVSLMREDSPVIRETTIVGKLYLADADNKKFRLHPDDKGRAVIGMFPDNLFEEVREAWGKMVSARLKRTDERLSRSTKTRSQFELLALDVLDDEDPHELLGE